MLNPLTIECGILLAILLAPAYLFGLIGTIYEIKNKNKRSKTK